MSFSIQYRSTRPVPPEEAEAIRRSAGHANEGRTWPSCEPVPFREDDDGHLIGFSKPYSRPAPVDAASAAREGLPDGTAVDLIDVLCRLSRDHAIDWALGHDHDPAIGFIRDGACDEKAMTQVEALADLAEILGGGDDD